MNAHQPPLDAVDALTRALSSGNVVIFAGAGVSMTPPAGLPNWLQLRDWTLEAVASRADFLAPFLPLLTRLEVLPAAGRKGMTPEVVASEIAKECAGYFQSLRVLDDGAPNANHQLISRLAKVGAVRTIVTTNFDIFIERALEAEGVEFDVYRGQDEFARFPLTAAELPKRVSVLKIHGCLRRPETIIATIETQARGLTAHHRFVLRWLQERCWFLYWGYSGWDLKVNLDYLGAVSAKELAPGFFWSLHEDATYKETVSPYVVELQNVYGSRGQIGHRLAVQAAAQALCAKGVGMLDEPTLTPDELHAWREEKDTRLRERLRSWAEGSVTEFAASFIFASLLSIAGKTEEAMACLTRVEKFALANGDALSLAQVSQRAGEVLSASTQLQSALQFFRRAEAIAREHDAKPILAASLEGLGAVLSKLGQPDAALTSLREAARLVADGDRVEHRGYILDSMGDICSARSQFEEALGFHKQAERVFRATGAKQGLATCLNKQAHLHRWWGEFDSARKLQEESLTIGREVLGDPSLVRDMRILGATIHLADGKLDAAYEELNSVMAEARRDGAMGVVGTAQLHLRVVEQLRGNHVAAAAIRREAIEHLRGSSSITALSTILREHAQDVLPLDGPEVALKLCEEARDLAVESSDFLLAALAYEDMGALHAEKLQNKNEAIACFRHSITFHRRVEQSGDAFVPNLLRRIAECRGLPPLDAEKTLATAAAADPLIAQALEGCGPDAKAHYGKALRGDALASAFERVHTAVHRVRRLTVSSRNQGVPYVQYLQAELDLSTAIGFDHHIATATADMGWLRVLAKDFTEGIRLLRSATDMSHNLGDTQAEILHKGNLGFALCAAGDEQAGFIVIEEAMGLAREHHFRERLLWLLQEQGQWYKRRNDGRATGYFKEAIEVAEEMGNRELASTLSFDLGKVYRETGQYEQSLHYRLRGIRALDALGTPIFPRLVVVANMLENELGRPAESLPYYERALELCGRDAENGLQVLGLYQRALGKLPKGLPETPVLDALTDHYGGMQEAAQALARWARYERLQIIADLPTAAARIVAVGLSTQGAVGRVLLANARSFMTDGDAKNTLTHLQEAERIAHAVGDRQWMGTVRRAMGDYYHAARNFEHAMSAWEEAERIAVISGNTIEVEVVRYTMARAIYDRGDTATALSYAEGALAAAREGDYPLQIAEDLVLIAEIRCARGELEQAEQGLLEAATIFEEHQCVPEWAEAHILRAEILIAMGRGDEALEKFVAIEETVKREAPPAVGERVRAGMARAKEVGRRVSTGLSSES